MKLYEGRPREERSPREMAAYDYLDQLRIRYRRVDHAAAETMEACEEIDRVLGVRMCKNLFLCNRQKTDFYLLLMPGDKPFRTKELSGQLGVARLSFACAEDMQEKLGLLPGSVSVMGLINDTEGCVRLLIDKELLCDAEIGCHPCVNTSSLAFSMVDLLEKVLPATGHVLTAVELSRAQ
ncbi:MAG: prolyl-tRNA synthetase associated domain-containing protein [Ruminococcaceae bacterium]|nr:prolyl-tRNA synthetase associated domain-containing protein [Oscillospiraceae bacterium]